LFYISNIYSVVYPVVYPVVFVVVHNFTESCNIEQCVIDNSAIYSWVPRDRQQISLWVHCKNIMELIMSSLC